jgi:hypothetical protein
LYVVSSAVILAAFATCAPAQVPPEKTEIARLLALGGERFSVHRTEHFLIVSDGDEGIVNPLADRLEAVYKAVVRFGDGMKLPIHPPPDPLPVLLFNRYSDFERYARAVWFVDPSAPGFYHLRNNTAAFCNVLDLPQLREISQRIEWAEAQRGSSAPRERINEWRSQRDVVVETFNRLVIRHETAHQVLFNTGVLSHNADHPDWLVEGLACQFEVSDPDAVNQMRLADFREALGAAPDADVFDEAALRTSRSNERFLSLADLIADKALNVADDSKRTFRYAQAWGLVYYLHHERGDSLGMCLRRIAAHTPNELMEPQHRIAEFEAVFGTLDQAFERAWGDYVLKLPIDANQAGR